MTIPSSTKKTILVNNLILIEDSIYWDYINHT